MIISDLDDTLVHAGKKGMKWGVRKTPLSPEHASVKSLRKNKARTLTDAELRQAIGRMNLEKQYKDLNPKGISRANKIALSILAIGTTVNSAIIFANSPAGKAVKDTVANLLARVKN
jgi:hypothetical protein